MNQPEIQQSSPAAQTAVDRCTQIFFETRSAVLAKTKQTFDAKEKATFAYRRAMPPLTGEQNIHDFIACVAQGILLGIIDTKESTTLLYAAQVALSPRARHGKCEKEV